MARIRQQPTGGHLHYRYRRRQQFTVVAPITEPDAQLFHPLVLQVELLLLLPMATGPGAGAPIVRRATDDLNGRPGNAVPLVQQIVRLVQRHHFGHFAAFTHKRLRAGGHVAQPRGPVRVLGVMRMVMMMFGHFVGHLPAADGLAPDDGEVAVFTGFLLGQ